MQFFTSSFVQLFRQVASGPVQSSERADSGVKAALQYPSSVQIALMQRMGVKGRPFMDACKRRNLST